MITTSHAVLNSALLGRKERPTGHWAALLGSILPDLPMFVYFAFYLVNHSHIRSTPGYLQEHHFRQLWVDWLHSIPLALAGALLFHLLKNRTGLIFFLAMFLHDLEDLPLHSEYAHQHFLPFSHWRFFSPLSYWDPRHFGAVIAPLEWLAVAACSLLLWKRGIPAYSQVLLIFLVVFHGMFLLYEFGGARW